MPNDTPNPAGAVRRLLRLAGQSACAGPCDRELLERFVMDRSESAFAALLGRHGSMVLSVCRRYLRDPRDAEDAFQATFLVLARKAGTVRWRESIAGWLFDVASRVAKKAAVQAARRHKREGGSTAQAPELPAPVSPPATDLGALQATLDEELRKLPEKLRTPVVLCHLEGLSQDEVARQLGISDGQLRGRLYRAREKLRENLIRRGFTLSAVLLALTVGPKAQAVPALLATATLRVALTNPAAANATVLTLTHGVTQEMSRNLSFSVVIALLGLLGLGAVGFALAPSGSTPTLPADVPLAGTATQPPLPAANEQPLAVADDNKDDDKKPEEKVDRIFGWLTTVTPDKNSFRVKIDDGEETEINLDSKTKVRFGKKPIAVADLKPNMRVELIYRGASNTPSEVVASWRHSHSEVKSLDLAKSTLTIHVENDGIEFEVALTVTPDATILVDKLPAGLADVMPGRKALLKLGLDKKTVIGIEAEGNKLDIPALVKSYDAVANTLLVEFDAEADDFGRRVTLALPVNADAKVRLAGADAKLTDLLPRMPVRLRMTDDRKAVAGILAAHPLPERKDDD